MAITKVFKRKQTTKPDSAKRARVVDPSARFAKQVKNIVRKELKHEIGTKTAVIGTNETALDSIGLGTGDMTTSSNFVKLLPLISQGNSEYNSRVGNEILLKSLNLKMLLRFREAAGSVTNNNPDYVSSRIGVRVMILRQKNSNSELDTVSNFQGDKLLENGAITTAGPAAFSGNTFNLLQKINTDQFTVKMDKVIYMSRPYDWHPESSAHTFNTYPEPKVVEKTLNFGRGLKLRFTEDDGENPVNFPYMMCIGMASTVTASVTPGPCIEYAYTANATYTDA